MKQRKLSSGERASVEDISLDESLRRIQIRRWTVVEHRRFVAGKGQRIGHVAADESGPAHHDCLHREAARAYSASGTAARSGSPRKNRTISIVASFSIRRRQSTDIEPMWQVRTQLSTSANGPV
jgi:hypothetical protein